MATSSGDLTELVEQHRKEGPFKPYAYYGSEEDALTTYWRGDADYARRLNSRVTVFLSLESDELVGCQIKSVRHVLEDIGWFDVSLKHGRVRVAMLFLACRGEFAGEPESRKIYRRIGEEVSRTQLEVDVGPPSPT